MSCDAVLEDQVASSSSSPRILGRLPRELIRGEILIHTIANRWSLKVVAPRGRRAERNAKHQKQGANSGSHGAVDFSDSPLLGGLAQILQHRFQVIRRQR